MSISEIDDPYAPWGELITFGNPWHGWQAADGLKRLDGAAMTLPEGVSHYRAEDGGARLIDLGMPAPAATSDPEKAQGMTWWNKAILAGSGLSVATPTRLYNPVRGSSASAMFFRNTVWPVRTSDGTTYVLWYSPDKKIRVAKLEQPTIGVPDNETGGAVALDLGAAVIDSIVVNLSNVATFKWINFAPNGRKAALHVGYLGTGQAMVVHQIIELDIASGSASQAPVVAVTLSRTGSALTTGTSTFTVVEIREKTMNMTSGGTQILDNSSDLSVQRIRYYGTFVPGGVSMESSAKWCYDGTDASSSATVLLVTYDASSNRVELGTLQEGSQVWTGSIAQPGYSYDYVTDGHGNYISGTNTAKKFQMDTTYQQHQRTCLTRNGVQVGAALYLRDQTGVWSHTETWFGAADVQTGDANGSISESSITAQVNPLYGNCIVASNPGISYDAERVPVATSRAVHGYACGDGGTVQSAALGTFTDIREFAVNPQTGGFVAGVTRYF